MLEIACSQSDCIPPIFSWLLCHWVHYRNIGTILLGVLFLSTEIVALKIETNHARVLMIKHKSYYYKLHWILTHLDRKSLVFLHFVQIFFLYFTNILTSLASFVNLPKLTHANLPMNFA